VGDRSHEFVLDWAGVLVSGTGLNHVSAAQPTISANSPTTSPDAYSKPADSDHDHSPDCNEPVIFALPDTQIVVFNKMDGRRLNRPGNASARNQRLMTYQQQRARLVLFNDSTKAELHVI